MLTPNRQGPLGTNPGPNRAPPIGLIGRGDTGSNYYSSVEDDPTVPPGRRPLTRQDRMRTSVESLMGRVGVIIADYVQFSNKFVLND